MSADAPIKLTADVESLPPRAREFFRVAKLVPEAQDVLTIPPGTRVRVALDLMAAHGFSQLPVVAAGTVIGVFTYRSLAQGLQVVRRQDDPLDAAVDDLLEDLQFVRAANEVGEILGALDRDGAVLVGDEAHLHAVTTTTDVVSFLWETARPFVLLQDVELAIRDLVRSACPDPDELARRISIAVNRGPGQNPPTALDELTMGELLGVVKNQDNFGQSFRTTFGLNRDLVLSQLNPILEIRNKVFHFRDEVTADELATLVSVRRWLHRKIVTVSAP